jgi:hypothetical protein
MEHVRKISVIGCLLTFGSRGLNTSLKMFLDRSAVLFSTLYVGDGRSYMYAGNNNGNNINDEIVAYSNHIEFSDVDVDLLLAGDSPQPFCGL